MVSKGVIVPVSQPTKWVSSLTYPCKPDGSLCICLDPKNLNKAIVWEHCKAPILEEISHWLKSATCFRKLDVKDFFWSIHLDEKSSYLTTFNTHHGRYQFLHMPFSLKMSQNVFQMCMDQVMDCLSGIIAIHNDICIYCHTPEEHEQHFLKLMQIAAQHGFVFNSSTCQIRQPQVTFYGAFVITKDMPPDPAKFQAM